MHSDMNKKYIYHMMMYVRAIREYLREEKNLHDLKDFGRCLLIVIAVMLFVRLIVAIVF